MQDQYREVFDLIVECLSNEKALESQQALITSIKLMSAEGKNPISSGTTFPLIKLNKILTKLLSSDKHNKVLITRLTEYLEYDDFCFYVWKLLLKSLTPTKMNQPSSVFVQNYLELLNVIIRPPCEKVQQNGDNDEVKLYFWDFFLLLKYFFCK